MVQRYFCPNCRKSFSISNNNGMRIHKEKIHMAIKLLCESNGIRAISRTLNIHQETVLKILSIAGKQSYKFTEDKVRNVKCEVMAVDEIHTIVQAKDWNVYPKKDDVGSQYTFLAVDLKSRFILNSLTGQRSQDNAVKFFEKVKDRVIGRFQLNTDAWNGYCGCKGHKNAVKTVFGDEIDHATEEKQFKKLGQFVSRSLAKTIRKRRVGNPDLEMASTSYVERTNLTLRNFNRRFTRSTLGFSKKLLNLRYSVSLFTWHQNFARKHTTLKTTPAIVLGVLSTIVSIQDLWSYTC